jgi:flagellar basal body L-ring protein FlgH
MSDFDNFLQNKMEAVFAEGFAAKMDQAANQSKQQFAGQVTGSDPSDPSNTTLQTKLVNDQTQTVFPGKRVVRPGDVVTVVGMRAF